MNEDVLRAVSTEKKERRKYEERLKERRVGLELKYQVPRRLVFFNATMFPRYPKS